MNEEQKGGFELMLKGYNVFLTGNAGTGKSYLLKQFISRCKLKSDELAITSTTGVSAQLINGQTLHSWAGIGLGDKSVTTLIKKIEFNSTLLSKWLNIKTLIIDEVSMLSGSLFNKLNKIAQNIRERQEPFGGIQIIVVGDFYQLPVIQKINGKHDFCFKSTTWSKCNFKVINLKTIMRQKNNLEFTNMLQNIRIGNITEEMKRKLQTRILSKAKKKELNSNEIKPTILYSINKNIDIENKMKLKELLIATKQKSKIYNLNIVNMNVKNASVNIDEYVEKITKPKKRIALAKGAQVMLTINLNNELNNGNRGVVTDFYLDDYGKEMPIVKFVHLKKPVKMDTYVYELDNNIIKLNYSQLPLKLAWATTIHKSQGSTLNLAIINLENIFEYGQAYVALSRIRDFNDLYIEGKINFSKFKVHPDVVQFYNDIIKSE